MEQLKPSLRGLVDAWADDATPAPPRVEAAWQNVRARAQAGEVPALETASTSLGPTLVVATLVAAAVAAALWLAGRDAPPPQQPQAIVAERPADPQPPPEPALDVEARVVVAPMLPAEPDDIAEEPAEPPARPAVEKPARRNRRPKPTADAQSLAAELALLRRARAALRSGRPAEALALAKTHRERHPHSKFAEERSATEVMALCGLGRHEQARAKALHFRKRYRGSAFEAGLIEACDQATAGR